MGIEQCSEAFLKKYLPDGLPEDVDFYTWLPGRFPALRRIFSFIEIVYGESDRGCVICASAFVDDALQMAVRGRLKKISDVSDDVLDSLLTDRPQPPLGSLSARTKIAIALGLVDECVGDAIDMMRKMRNDAAHLANSFSFENPRYKIESLFKSLSSKERLLFGALDIVRQTDKDHFMAVPLRRLFEMATVSMYSRLSMLADYPNDPKINELVFGDSGPFDVHFDDIIRLAEKQRTEAAATTSSEANS